MYFTLGWVFFGAGFIGVFLPVIPTTPFMLLALWGFSRSSPRFHDWLHTHRVFGPPLQQWNNHRVIPPFAKYTAVFFMTASLFYLWMFLSMALWIKLVALALIGAGCWFVLSKPSFPPRKQACEVED
jgi:uncharacterized membrane protein YbaN (DUF454 family)